jgi:type II secretory pathway predicted ATPase ExeA
MSDHDLLAQYGLKFNPFLPSLPPEALWALPGVEAFFLGVENLVLDGGFALIEGDPGLGKSKTLHRLAGHLERTADVVVGVMERPQSKLGDFYRELGDLFSVDLTPANRYGGFMALRERWRAHIKSTLFRPVLLVDEAQEMATPTLNELRIIGSANFDSEILLTTILCGDNRLSKRFRTPQLLPLGTRIRTRLSVRPLAVADLLAYLDHILVSAGAPHLLTDDLKRVMAEHSAGSLRMLTSMGAELLPVAAARRQRQLDEQLFLEHYAALQGRRA